MRKLTLNATAMAVGGLAACGQAAPSTASAGARSSDCGTGPVSSSLVRTASYEFTAAAGGLEATYSKGTGRRSAFDDRRDDARRTHD